MFTGKNLSLSLLVGLIFLWSLGSLLCVFLLTRSTSQLRGLQTQAARMESSRNFLRALATDCLEYSKKNPAINPVLISVGLNPMPAPAATKAK